MAFFLANLLRVYLESPLAASGESGWLVTIGVRTEAGPVIRWPGLIIETTVFAVVAILLIYNRALRLRPPDRAGQGLNSISQGPFP